MRASSAAAKGTVALGVKIMAAVVITAAVSTAGVALLPKQLPPVVVAAPEMGGELGEVITRLKREIGQGLGDGVGVLTESYNETDNQKPISFPSGSMTLYAQQGESHLFMRYSINLEMNMRTGKTSPRRRLPRTRSPMGGLTPRLTMRCGLPMKHRPPIWG